MTRRLAGRAAAGAAGAEVAIRAAVRRTGLRTPRVREAARAAAAAGAAGRVRVGILLTSDRTLRRLNREFRGLDRATDVLSFPDGGRDPDGWRRLGDLAISVEAAARQAAASGWSLTEVVERLTVHGVLHLLGHDHETDEGEMMSMQGRILRSLRRGPGR
jgi:probable rRNA maturation factor